MDRLTAKNHGDVLYALRDPLNGAIRYLGVTNNVQRRLKAHVQDCRTADHHRARWWRSVLEKAGRAPAFDVLLKCGDLDWRAVEPFFIAAGRHLGLRLTNCSDGGEGIRNPAPEVVSRRKLSDETRARISAALTGRKRSPEAIARAAAAHVGKKRSAETRALLSEKAKARSPFSAEHRANLSASHRTENLTPETRQRMSNASKNRSDEWRSNHSARVRGQTRTAEQRQRISDGTRMAWVRRKAV